MKEAFENKASQPKDDDLSNGRLAFDLLMIYSMAEASGTIVG